MSNTPNKRQIFRVALKTDPNYWLNQSIHLNNKDSDWLNGTEWRKLYSANWNKVVEDVLMSKQNLE